MNRAPFRGNSICAKAPLLCKAAHESVVILSATGPPAVRDLQSAFRARANEYRMKPFPSLQIGEKLVRFDLPRQSNMNCDK